MVFYQVLILIAVVLIICLLAYVVHVKNRLVMMIVILVVASVGAAAFCFVQYVFSSRFYEQKVNVNYLKDMRFAEYIESDYGTVQKEDLKTLFSDYKDYKSTSDFDTYMLSAIRKEYKINANGASSAINSYIFTFESRESAEQFFTISQKFYETKNYLPAESKYSLTKKGNYHRYMTSYIKSVYKDYKDIIYLPSKITYQSEVMVLDGNVVVYITETANKPVTNKDRVLAEINSKLAAG